MDHGISMDSTADRPNIENLKEHPGRPAVDEGLIHAAFNPDTECLKLRADEQLQSTALGHSPASHGYEDLHAREQPGENTSAAATVDLLEYSNGSVSRLDTPDLGLIVPTTEEEPLQYGSDIMPIPRENISNTPSSQHSQVVTSAPRENNLPELMRQQDEVQGQGHQVQGEEDSNHSQQSEEQDQSEVRTNSNNHTTEIIDNLTDLKTESILSEDS